MSMEQAERLLQSGYKFLSKFGRWCPVQVAQKKIPIQLYQALQEQGEVYPVAHRRFIYFLGGEKNRDLFKNDPLRYVNQEADLPLLPLKIAIIGPPKCGKTNLCERLARNLGLKVISVGQAIRFVLNEMGWTEMAVAINEHLTNGDVVPYSLAVRCVEAATMDSRSATQGFVIDGFPNTVDQIKELAALRMIPYLVISIHCSLHTCLHHAQKEKNNFSSRPIFSAELLRHKYRQWELVQPENRIYLHRKYKNLVVVDGEHSTWWLYNRVKELIFPVMNSITKYFQDIRKGKAASLDRMCVTEEEFNMRKSQLKQYCPVCLKLRSQLESGGSQPFKEGLIQYMDKYYWVCNQHMQLFTSNPQRFVPPKNTATLPEHLPKAIEATELDMQIVAKNGYCIVTYCENLPQKHLVKGQAQFGVHYRDEVYLFSNAECQDRFLKTPDTYLKHEICTLSTDLQYLDVTSLPCMGFLEQITSKLLHKTIIAVGADRPKYPGLDLPISAAVYVGYLLKKYNKRTPSDEKLLLKETCNVFMNRCQILRKAILATRKHNPFLRLDAAVELSPN